MASGLSHLADGVKDVKVDNVRLKAQDVDRYLDKPAVAECTRPHLIRTDRAAPWTAKRGVAEGDRCRFAPQLRLHRGAPSLFIPLRPSSGRTRTSTSPLSDVTLGRLRACRGACGDCGVRTLGSTAAISERSASNQLLVYPWRQQARARVEAERQAGAPSTPYARCVLKRTDVELM